MRGRRGGLPRRGGHALFTVRFLVGYFKTRTLTPFAVYCLVFGLAMIVYTQT